jgi:hypothetical protein
MHTCANLMVCERVIVTYSAAGRNITDESGGATVRAEMTKAGITPGPHASRLGGGTMSVAIFRA